MKRLLTFLVVGLLATSLWAQSPEKMSYQAVIRNSSNEIIVNQQVGMQISILQGSINGSAVYIETHTPTTNSFGLVSLEIGGGTTSDDFSIIDWANGPYFVQTQTDLAGGSSYTITGTSQLLSVPYALHAKTAEIISETDPVFKSSEAANITTDDITNLGNLSGINSGDEDLSSLATKTALEDSIAQVRSEIPEVSGFLTSYTETDPSVPSGTQIGQMQYWDGSSWVVVSPPKYDSALLQFIGGKPTWVGGTPPSVTSLTGRIWMDRNLGATQVATSSTDVSSYGGLFQWGRAADGHESRTSSLTSTRATSDTPGHGDYITHGSSPYDWRSPKNDNLWQGIGGINNPCPSGYRLPTEAEWQAERATWGSNDAAGAFGSPLKLPLAGVRSYTFGTVALVGSYGYYWASTVDGTTSKYLGFTSSDAFTLSNLRAIGYSVRCIKD